MPLVARHLMIHGRVQGVWYRAWAVETARQLGLAGWVRNRSNGCVEALVEGEAEATERFVALAQDGPTGSKVARIDVVEVEVEGLSGFEKRATV